jgi:membrane-bound lytic murein transglycosylase B
MLTILKKHILATLVAAPMLIGHLPQAAALDVNGHPDLQKLVEQVASESSYSTAQLKALFLQVERKERIIEILSRPAESKPWHEYRKLFLTEKNVRDGVRFWRQHEKTLKRAETEYGVPPEIIVATLGIETRYGTNTGGFRVIDALTTIALDYPRRSKYFLRELREFLLLADEQRLSPLQLTGSYAGAIGYPQFMPSSYRAYAVDFDNDGHVDLVNSMEDAIGSIASYYRRHGWKSGQPVGWDVRVAGDEASQHVSKKLKTTHTLSALLAAGVELENPVTSDVNAALIELEGEQGPQYRIVFDNFFVITRYNTSRLYATAVQLLGEQVRQRIMESG